MPGTSGTRPYPRRAREAPPGHGVGRSRVTARRRPGTREAGACRSRPRGRCWDPRPVSPPAWRVTEAVLRMLPAAAGSTDPVILYRPSLRQDVHAVVDAAGADGVHVDPGRRSRPSAAPQELGRRAVVQRRPDGMARAAFPTRDGVGELAGRAPHWIVRGVRDGEVDGLDQLVVVGRGALPGPGSTKPVGTLRLAVLTRVLPLAPGSTVAVRLKVPVPPPVSPTQARMPPVPAACSSNRARGAGPGRALSTPVATRREGGQEASSGPRCSRRWV